MTVFIQTSLLLVLSNLIMTFAWSIFVPFTVYYMNQPLKLDFLWAGFCLLGALYFSILTRKQRIKVIA